LTYSCGTSRPSTALPSPLPPLLLLLLLVALAAAAPEAAPGALLLLALLPVALLGGVADACRK
jgi:hypothetical protein